MSVTDQPACGAGIDTQLFEHHDDGLGVFGIVHVDNGVISLAFRLSEFLGGLGRHRLPTGLADGFVARDIRATPWTGNRSERVRFVPLGDVDAVDSSYLTVGITTEHGDVPRGDARSANPSMMVLDVGLVEVSTCEERGAGFAEVGERYGLVNARALRSLFERLEDHVVGDSFDGVQLRPQRRVAVSTIGGVALQPVVDVRRTRDERDRPAALLAFGRDLKAVFVVLHVSDGEVFELPTPKAGVELEREHSFIARVERGVNHRQDILVPVEHLARVGRRVVRRRRAGGHPVNAIGDLLVVSDALGEDAERDAVVPVGFLVVIGAVDPGDDGLRCVAVVEGIREPADAFCDSDTAPEEFLVAVVAVGLAHESHAVAEGDQRLTVGVRDVFAGPCSLSERIDSVGETTHGFVVGERQDHNNIVVALNLTVQALLRLHSLGLEPLPTGIGTLAESENWEGPAVRFGAATPGGVAA